MFVCSVIRDLSAAVFFGRFLSLSSVLSEFSFVVPAILDSSPPLNGIAPIKGATLFEDAFLLALFLSKCRL